jgi:hypothetical protein
VRDAKRATERNFLMSWSSAFEDPVALPKGKQLLTLQQAANYIMKLPKAKQKLPEW